MSKPARSLEWTVWGGLLLIVLTLCVIFVESKLQHQPRLPDYGTVPDFTLNNQDGRAMSMVDLRGKPWVADIIFTRCPGQCLMMSQHMKELQVALPSDSPAQLVSLTTDPGFDTPAVLKKYAGRFGAQDSRWRFLTGDKATIRHVAVDGLKLALIDKNPDAQENPNDLFIHSAKFVLIDKRGEVRGYFDGETAGCVAEIADALQTLSREN